MADSRDPVKTQAYIDDALGRFLRIPGRVDRTYYAWVYLRGMRRLGDDQLCRDLNIKVKPVDTAPSDLDLADAEHYMYARFLAGSTGDPATKSLVYGYELVKVVRYLTGREKDCGPIPAFQSCRHPRKRSRGARKEPKTACRITATPMEGKRARWEPLSRPTKVSPMANTRTLISPRECIR